MLALAAAMLLAPRLLESVRGTVVVFGAAVVTCLVVVLFDPRTSPSSAPPDS
jgi:hypothetical protein